MGLTDWLGLGKNPALDHLVQVYGLAKSTHAAYRRCWEGSAHGHTLRIVPPQRMAAHREGLLLELGDCARESCFGFFRPDPSDLKGAADFGPDWLERYQEGEVVRLGNFQLECEGDPDWHPLISLHAVSMADYLARYSDALQWVDLRLPGISFLLGELVGREEKRPPDLKALERDVACSARLLDFVLEAERQRLRTK